MNDLKTPTRSPRASEPRDPVLWIVILVSLAVLGVVGYAKFKQHQEQSALAPAGGAKSSTPYFSGEPYAPSDPGMEPDTVMTIEAVSEDGTIKSVGPAGTAGKKPPPRDYGSDCQALLREQGEIEARLRRPHGTEQAEGFNAQLRDIAAAMTKHGC